MKNSKTTKAKSKNNTNLKAHKHTSVNLYKTMDHISRVSPQVSSSAQNKYNKFIKIIRLKIDKGEQPLNKTRQNKKTSTNFIMIINRHN